MSVVLIDNSFNLKINLGLIGSLTNICTVHCFTDYTASLKFLQESPGQVRFVFINPNLDAVRLMELMEHLQSEVCSGKMTVRVLYRYDGELKKENLRNLDFTGMPITRNEIELLKAV